MSGTAADEADDRAASPVDERAIVAGTTSRFVMLMVLLLTASGVMTLPVVAEFRSTDYRGCELAAGIDPANGGTAAGLAAAMNQEVPFAACVSKYAPSLPLWTLLAWPLGLAVVGCATFFVLRPLTRRRRGLVPLPDPPEALLAELAHDAGLSRVPTVMVDMAATPRGAEVFGSDRRPIVAMPNTLFVAARNDDVDGLRAVALHEFAHIKHRDVTVTYATVALWRAFILCVLTPFAVWEADQIYRDTGLWRWPPDVTPGLARALLLPTVTVALVYLARADVLRTRELYADLAAVRHGAVKRKWEVQNPAATAGRFKTAWASFSELWQTHPRLESRRSTLDDPAPLFGIKALPTFLVGVASLLIAVDVPAYLVPFTYKMSMWLSQAMYLVPALLVAAVVGVALWRSAAYAVATGLPAPSGARVGLWLGLGIAAGDLLAGNDSGNGAQWWPARPLVLLLPVGFGIAFTWWVSQCAQLWAKAWRGGGLRVPVAIGLVSAWLVLGAWFCWWVLVGVATANGYSPSTAGFRAILTNVFSVSGHGHSATLAAAAAVTPWLDHLFLIPLVPVAAMLCWTVPAAAWAMGSARGLPRWATRLRTDAEELRGTSGTVPSPRGVVRAGLIGGGAGIAGVIGLQAVLHHWQPHPPHTGTFGLARPVWILLVLVIGATGAAITGVVASGGLRLVSALIAAEIAALVGIAGMFPVVSTDGCLPALNTLGAGCRWRPPWNYWHLWFPLLLSSVVVASAVAAVVVAALGSAALRVRERANEKPVRALKPVGAVPDWEARSVRIAVGAVAVVAATILIGQMSYLNRSYVMTTTPASVQAATRQFVAVPTTAVDADLATAQVHAWYRLGGHYLLTHAQSDSAQLITDMRTAVDTKRTAWTDMGAIGQICDRLGQWATWANGRYFRVPDRQAGTAWQQFGALATQGSQDCRKGLDQRNTQLFGTGLRALMSAGTEATAATNRVTAMLRAAGYRDVG